MKEDITNQILLALTTATAAQKAAALQALTQTTPPAPTPSNDGPLLCSVSEAARRLNVSRTSLWRLMSSGRLKKVELFPGFKRIRCADLEALVKGAS